jgi:hypothetical protein
MEVFREFQNRDEFFEKLTGEKDMLQRIAGQCVLLAIFSSVYGVVMGAYNGILQAISSGIKVPLLFALALVVCFPAFFILQHVLGSKLGFWQMLAVILSGFVMIALVMASFRPHRRVLLDHRGQLLLSVVAPRRDLRSGGCFWHEDHPGRFEVLL